MLESITGFQVLFQLLARHTTLFFATPKLSLIGFDCYLSTDNVTSMTYITVQQIILELLPKFRVPHSYQANNTFPSVVILFYLDFD